MKLTEKILSKWFGQDDSDGQTCDCKECVIRKQILDNQEIVERLKEWIEIQETLYNTEKYIEDLKSLTFNPWDQLEELKKISRGEKYEFI